MQKVITMVMLKPQLALDIPLLQRELIQEFMGLLAIVGLTKNQKNQFIV